MNRHIECNYERSFIFTEFGPLAEFYHEQNCAQSGASSYQAYLLSKIQVVTVKPHVSNPRHVRSQELGKSHMCPNTIPPMFIFGIFFERRRNGCRNRYRCFHLRVSNSHTFFGARQLSLDPCKCVRTEQPEQQLKRAQIVGVLLARNSSGFRRPV